MFATSKDRGSEDVPVLHTNMLHDMIFGGSEIGHSSVIVDSAEVISRITQQGQPFRFQNKLWFPLINSAGEVLYIIYAERHHDFARKGLHLLKSDNDRVLRAKLSETFMTGEDEFLVSAVSRLVLQVLENISITEDAVMGVQQVRLPTPFFVPVGCMLLN